MHNDGSDRLEDHDLYQATRLRTSFIRTQEPEAMEEGE
jgi:hypothetical protein